MKMAQRVWDFGLTDGVMFPWRRPGVPLGAVTLDVAGAHDTLEFNGDVWTWKDGAAQIK